MTETSPSSDPDAPDGAPLPAGTVLEIRDQCLCLAAQQAARRLARRFDRLFAPLGITNGQFSLMVALSGDWAPRLGELAGVLAMDHATMSAAVRTLARRGLVTLRPDEADARARRPVLTRAGRAVLNRAVPLWRQEHARLLGGVEPDEAAALSRLLGRLG